ncbi:MAG: ATP-dependent DNA helicase RecG [Pseudomonadota bacterium]
MRPALLNPLFADLTALTGVGPKSAALISKVSGPRIVDVMFTRPFGFIDRSHRPLLDQTVPGELATVTVTVDRHEPPPVKARPYRVICTDETGFLVLVFFRPHVDYLLDKLPVGGKVIVSGKIEDYNGSRQMTHPDHIVAEEEAANLPEFDSVYPLTHGLAQSTVQKAVRQSLKRLPALPEWIGPDWLDKNNWPSFEEAMTALHLPASKLDTSGSSKANERLAYDEFLSNQLALRLIRADRRRRNGRTSRIATDLRQKVRDALPYKLTGSQETVIAEIDNDMASDERMVRLVQGDVGSGKTLVAFFAALNTIASGRQAALMAPTEILARQHAESLEELCDVTGLTSLVLTGRDKGQEREAKLTGISKGYVDLVIGTHALFQESVEFADLGLAIVDEQHRFGVHQRMSLSSKGATTGAIADMLVMTATPIPRTLALAGYGDMDFSAITEKPPGRKPIETRTIPLQRTDEVQAAVRRAVEKGEQVYWVCPLVEESDVSDLTSAETRAATLKETLGEQVGLIHGKMAPTEKDHVMAEFAAGTRSVLVATTVIEVGVNVPNATVMVIEHAERFGLAQLHQLRGRVGRGSKAGVCLLLYKSPIGDVAKARLSMMRETNDGFRIAEEDLRLRGAGDLLGAAQSGLPRFRLGDPANQSDLLKAANDDAKMIVEQDPTLATERGQALRILLYLFGQDQSVRLLGAG